MSEKGLPLIIQGTPISPGLAQGPVHVHHSLHSAIDVPVDIEQNNVKEEFSRLDAATARISDELLTLPGRGLGIALKIADGSARARSVALLAILDYLGALSDEEKHKLQAHISPTIINSRGLVVKEIRPAASWLPGLDRENRLNYV